MYSLLAKILIIMFPIASVAYIVMSVVLFIKRKKIMKHYNNSFGYISSFIFSAFIFCPVIPVVSFVLGQSGIVEAIIFTSASLIYCVPAVKIYLYMRRKCHKNARRGLFFAMLGIGLSSPLFIFYKGFIDSMQAPAKRSKGHSVTTYHRTFNGGLESYTNTYNELGEKTGTSKTTYTKTFNGGLESYTEHLD